MVAALTQIFGSITWNRNLWRLHAGESFCVPDGKCWSYAPAGTTPH
jgi:hypothetical protein